METDTHHSTFMMSVFECLSLHRSVCRLFCEWIFVGQVLTKENIQNIIRFAKEQNLLLMADEVSGILFLEQFCIDS